MSYNKWQIELIENDRKALEKYIKTGKRSVKLFNRAKIILALDKSNGRIPKKDTEIAESIGVSRQTVQNVKVDFINAKNVDTFLQRKKRETPPVEPKITGDVEAHIIAIACSPVPEGHSKWTLRLIADKCVELQYIDKISHMSVSRVLKKQNSNLI